MTMVVIGNFRGMRGSGKRKKAERLLANLRIQRTLTKSSRKENNFPSEMTLREAKKTKMTEIINDQ